MKFRLSLHYMPMLYAPSSSSSWHFSSLLDSLIIDYILNQMWFYWTVRSFSLHIKFRFKENPPRGFANYGAFFKSLATRSGNTFSKHLHRNSIGKVNTTVCTWKLWRRIPHFPGTNKNLSGNEVATPSISPGVCTCQLEFVYFLICISHDEIITLRHF